MASKLFNLILFLPLLSLVYTLTILFFHSQSLSISPFSTHKFTVEKIIHFEFSKNSNSATLEQSLNWVFGIFLLILKSLNFWVLFCMYYDNKVMGHETVELKQYPLVVSTWPFIEAVRAAWRAVDGGSSAVDSVVEGCSTCEELRCDGTVGPGGSPDENGETTMDALVMDGVTMEVGAVAAMRYVKDGIKAARLVMQHTEHTLLVGEKASEFAISMGLPGPTNLSSSESIEKWTKWKNSSCQPNFRKNVLPANNCGPYRPNNYLDRSDETCPDTYQNKISRLPQVGLHSHDTISMAVIDRMGHIAVGTSTNGATFKVPGRVGDGPIAGSSAYAVDEVGACCATGDGDVMMRFLPCYQVVESMRLGMEPKLAAKDAIARITKKFPDFVGAVVALSKTGEHAGACHGWIFKYSVRSPAMKDVEVFTVLP